MKTIIFKIALLTMIISSFALPAASILRGEEDSRIKILFDSDKMDTIIGIYNSEPGSFLPMDYIYLGRAYTSKRDFVSAYNTFKKFVLFDSMNPESYNIAGKELIQIGLINQAIGMYSQAIELAPDSSKYYTGMAAAYYYNENFDSAMEYCRKALQKNNPLGDNYYMLATIFNLRDNIDSALAYYYLALKSYNKNDANYTNCLKQIVYFEFSKERYDNAEKILEQILDVDSADVHAIEKMLQVQVIKQRYKSADSLVEKLYAAFKTRRMPDDLTTMFCFLIMKVDDKILYFNERFADPPPDSLNRNKFIKHIIYVHNRDNDSSLYRICTESHNEIVKKGSKYIMMKGNIDEDEYYEQYIYEVKVPYSEIVKAATAIALGKAKPTKVIKKPVDE